MSQQQFNYDEPYFWFTGKDKLIELGFTESEIKAAIAKTKLTVESLTSTIDVEATKSNYFDSTPKHFQFIREVVGHFTEIKYVKGQEWKRDYTAKAKQYRQASQYQGCNHGEILRKLFEAKWSWFKKFKWDIYSIESGIAEIYMKTTFGTLYVPVEALIKGNYSLVEKRMISYWSSYRNQNKTITAKSSEYELNGKPNKMTVNEYVTQQNNFYKKEIKPLQSRQAKALQSFLGGN